MGPENLNFGGGPVASVLHPLVAVVMVLAILMILGLPRKFVIVPAMVAIFLIPKGQQLVLAGVHLNVYRILILTGLARWRASRRSFPLAGGFNSMDRLVTALFVSLFVTNSLLHGLQTQALIKDTGDLLDFLGGYIVIRFLIRDREDVQRAIKAFAMIAIVNAALMLNEQRTGENILGLLGGVPDLVIRDGKIRSFGSFEIFLTAGTFGAALIPLLIWLWSQARGKMISALGILAATTMAVTCNASTSLLGYAAGIVALCFWPIRKSMRLVRWGIVAMVVALHMVMNGPVWSILEHIDLTGSSSSYHRYALVDSLIRHFADWWLVGTVDNAGWGYFTWDLSNQYVAYAFTGGLSTFVLFLMVISKGFSQIGTTRKLAEGNRSEEWFLWCLGASMFSHVISFLGVNYMDQLEFAWLALLASITVAVIEVTPSVAPQVEEIQTSYDVCAVQQ